MSVPTFIPFLDPYKVYAQAGGVAQPNATTMQQMQNLFGNWSDMLATFVKCLWQPSKAYVINQIVWSPSMPANTVAICTKAGTSGSSEPSWPRLINGTASDGGATWKLIEAHPQTLPANGGTADVAENAKKLGGQLPAYYATAANLNLKAPIANPNFTGVPKGPTAAPGTNTTQLATTAFVTTALSSLTGQGKIVAYNLAQNGYVKWDIGLILQWGRLDNYNYTSYIEFPLKFSKIPIVVFQTQDINISHYTAHLVDVAMDKFSAVAHQTNGYTYNINIRWIALGD